MEKKLKNLIRNVALAILLVLFSAGAIVVSIVVGTNMLQKEIYTVSIYDSGKLTEIRTTNLSVQNALDVAKIELGKHDRIYPAITANLDDNNTDIRIDRAKEVTIKVENDEPKTVYTLKDSIADVLIENNIQIGTFDYINQLPENSLKVSANNIVYKAAKVITISINGVETVVHSTKDTIGEVLAENGIYVNDEDFVNQTPSDNIPIDDAQIAIVTAHSLTLKYDGITKTASTQAKTVGELLTEYKVKLSGLDRLANGITVNTRIKDNLIVSVIRVIQKKESTVISLPYKTENIYTDKLLKDIRGKTTAGSKGSRTDTYNIIIENGKEVSRTLASSVVTKQPVNNTTEIGTKTYPTFSASFKRTHSYTKVIDMKAVSYNLGNMTNRLPSHPNYGRCANGMLVRAGIIAVDRNVIPVGTKVYVEYAGGADYGYAIAADVGVSGYHIDLYLNSVQECRNWGKRAVKVYILEDQKVDIFKLRGG